jgi:hypothetical protein
MPSGFESNAIFFDPHELVSDPYVAAKNRYGESDGIDAFTGCDFEESLKPFAPNPQYPMIKTSFSGKEKRRLLKTVFMKVHTLEKSSLFLLRLRTAIARDSTFSQAHA